MDARSCRDGDGTDNALPLYLKIESIAALWRWCAGWLVRRALRRMERHVASTCAEKVPPDHQRAEHEASARKNI
jgi:hypothetical protein